MRISSQHNQFVFNFPTDFIEERLNKQFNKLLEKNFIPYDTIIDYINSSIKEFVFPSASFEVQTQLLKFGKEVNWKDSKNILDTFTNELDITFRDIDSHLNYFILLEVLIEFYLNNDKEQIPSFSLEILDKDGSLLYSIIFEEILLKSIGELRLGYQHYDVSEKLFTITFRYNFLDIRWALDDDDKNTTSSIFDIPIDFKPGDLDSI